MEPMKTPQKYNRSCEQFAAKNQVVAQTVRARICRTGHYFGVRPQKLAKEALIYSLFSAKSR